MSQTFATPILKANREASRRCSDETYTDAFLVLKNSCVITEEYRNGMRADSHHLLNSVSKSFIGMLAGILAVQGVIDPHKPLTHYLPELENTAFQGTSIQQAPGHDRRC